MKSLEQIAYESATITVEHNGRRATVSIATVYMLEQRPQDVAEAARAAFDNTTKP